MRNRIEQLLLGLLNFVLLICIANSVAISQTLSADEEFALGMSANSKGEADAALIHLQRAIVLDPGMTRAHFALGATFDLWCGTNSDRCALAIQEYKKTLELDAFHKDALKGLAYALYSVNLLDESEDYYRKVLALDSNDPAALCGVVAITSQRSWRDVAVTKSKYQMSKGERFQDTNSCHEMRGRNLARVEEGIGLITKAFQVRNNSADLTGYLSYLYTIRSEIQCGNAQEYKKDKVAAKKWDHMGEKIRKKNGGSYFLQKCPAAPPPPQGHANDADRCGWGFTWGQPACFHI